MNNGDPVLSEASVLGLVRRHLRAATRVTRVDESGRKGRAYFIDDDIVLKTQRPHRLRGRVVEEFETSLEKEAFFLAQLALEPTIKTPRPLGYGREQGVEYVCMTRMPGVSLRRANLTDLQREGVLGELGALLRRIHDLPQSPFAESNLFPRDGPAAELKARLATLFGHLVEAIHALPEEWQLRSPAEQVAEAALAALPNTTERVALHSNPAGEHVFVDPDTLAFSGLIDFGDAYISHPALDFRPWRDDPDRLAILAGYNEAGVVSASFLITMRVGQILRELSTAVQRRQSPQRSDENIERLLGELR